MDISKWGFQNRNLVYFLVAVLLAGGALACYQMSKLEDPEIKVKLQWWQLPIRVHRPIRWSWK